jgi:hypothetical protein
MRGSCVTIVAGSAWTAGDEGADEGTAVMTERTLDISASTPEELDFGVLT